MSGALSTRDLLSRCTTPRELRRLEREQLDQLAAQIRAFLIDNVSRRVATSARTLVSSS